MNNQPDTISKLFLELDNHLTEDEKPSVYLNKVYGLPVFRKFPFSMLYILKNTQQPPEHHPEGSVWNHTLLVVDEAAKEKYRSKNQKVFMWAALLHDIGKPSTTKMRKGRITSYDHHKVGADLSEKFLGVFSDDTEFINDVSQLVRYHMQILFVVKDLPFADIEGMKKDTDINEVALLGFCDRVGRQGKDREKEEENIRLFLQKCENTE